MTIENTSPVRHAVSRSTGSTTWVRRDGDTWKIDCLNHGATTTASNRAAAWKNGSTPAQFCLKCKTIAAGKADKIKGDRLPIPTAKPKAAKKAKAKKATTPTPTTDTAVEPSAKKAA